MKSNEDFIAGIYAKAEHYTEEKVTKPSNIIPFRRVLQVAAMFTICLGLAGAGIMTLRNGAGDKTPSGDHGISMMSLEDEFSSDLINSRMVKEMTLVGTVREIITETNTIWLYPAESMEGETYTQIPVTFANGEFTKELSVGVTVEVTGRIEYHILSGGAPFTLMVSEPEALRIITE